MSAWPCSSKAITTIAAPKRRASRARSRNSSSPSLRLIEFTTGLPCTQRRPAWITDHLELSIMIGTRAISGSVATMLRNVVMAASESSMASSMFTSMMFAPLRTCSVATSSAVVKSSARIRSAKRRDPVTLVRSPIMVKLASGRRISGSRPARRVSPSGCGMGRGALPSAAAATARMWSGVVPQQPPMMLTKPLAANSPSSAAVCSGSSSYSPKTLGRPAFG